MSEEQQLASDSDTDDEDYIPDGAEQDVSEAESEGDVVSESDQEDENNENEQKSKKKRGKRGKRGKKKLNKRAKLDIETQDSADTGDGEKEKKNGPTEEEEKKRADSLWADFMKDTGTAYKPKPQNSTNNSTNSTNQQENSTLYRPKIEEKVKITKVFEFAGEEIKIEKQVSADSAEARLSHSGSVEKSMERSESSEDMRKKPVRRAGSLGGISSVLGQIGKKSKLSTLEKSKLDWDSFKKEENIDEEISTYNKGKDGYLERQDFLQRTDLRQFEIEKNLRTISRRNNR